jgi:hypothetical protein
MRRVTVALEETDYARFRVEAAKIDASMGAVGRSLIVNWLKERDGKTKDGSAAVERDAVDPYGA